MLFILSSKHSVIIAQFFVHIRFSCCPVNAARMFHMRWSYDSSFAAYYLPFMLILMLMLMFTSIYIDVDIDVDVDAYAPRRFHGWEFSLKKRCWRIFWKLNFTRFYKYVIWWREFDHLSVILNFPVEYFPEPLPLFDNNIDYS